MVHPRAKLTLLGRLLLVRRIEEEGWAASCAAEAVGVARATAYKWVRRYRANGFDGLRDRSSRPRRSPRALTATQVDRILQLRRDLKHGPHRLAPSLGHPRSTVYAVLRRHGCSRLRDFDRPTALPIRYVRERPGELLHVDVKKLGRIPPGGGHRMVGPAQGRKNRCAAGYDYLHVAVDDASRVAFVQVLPNEQALTSASFLIAAAGYFAAHGVRIERVLTDQGVPYRRSRIFPETVAELGARHCMTRPYRPQTNGKAERFIRTLVEEWAYSKLYPSNQARLDALTGWLEFYNCRRPHTGLRGKPPMAILVSNVRGNYT